MITFNGKRYVKNASALVDTLFTGGGTASGIYKQTPRGTKLYKPNGELFAYVVHNDKQGYFVVTASLAEGKPHYMHGLCSIDAHYLGIGNIGLQDISRMIRESFVSEVTA